MKLIIYKKLIILFFLPLYLKYSFFILFNYSFIFFSFIICMEERESLNKEIRLRETERRERGKVKRDEWLKGKRKIFLMEERESLNKKNTKNNK